MSEYKTIGDYAEAFSGYAFSSEDLVEDGVPVIKIGNIQNGIVVKECDSCYQKEITGKLKRYILDSDDFLIAMTGAGSVGRAGKMRGSTETVYLVNQRVAIVRTRDNANPDYLFYYFSMPYVERYLYSLGIGAGQPNISAKDIMKTKVAFPDKNVQDKIADILVKYDELIDCNKLRIRILEQMAENLYKEWFVRFRFPGHEDDEFSAGEPKDWVLTKLEEIINIDRGLSYSSDEIDCDEGADLINLKNIQAFGGFRIEGTKKYSGKYKEQQIVQRGDLVMGVTDMTQDRRTVGAVALIPVIHNISVISADLIKLTSKLNNVFLYCMFKYGGVSRYISQFANGANVLHLRPQVVNRVKVFLPTENIIDMFSKVVQPIIDEVDLLNEKNDNLIKQRDLLLPRLMSGKLEVK